MEFCEAACRRSGPGVASYRGKKRPGPQGSLVNICNLPSDIGTGSEKNDGWFYDSEKTECKAFQYSGAGGNANRYKNRKMVQFRVFFIFKFHYIHKEHPVNSSFPIDLQPKNNAKENVDNFVIKMFAIWKKIEENVLEDFRNGKFISHDILKTADTIRGFRKIPPIKSRQVTICIHGRVPILKDDSSYRQL